MYGFDIIIKLCVCMCLVDGLYDLMPQCFIQYVKHPLVVFISDVEY